MARAKNDKPWKEEKPRYQKMPTTNMAMDSHKRFCRRCFAHNKGCPNPRGQKECSL